MSSKSFLTIFAIIFIIFFRIKKYILLFSQYYQLSEGRKYLNYCLENKQFKKKINIKSLNPNVSIIIPVYNCENSIKLSVASIQNQIFEGIEIILVNDYSKDKTKKVIENIQKEEPRIVIINNNKNMGTLYSRNIGAIYANGKYIFCLDNDDMFLRDNLISRIYKIAMKYNYDIVGFNVINANNYNAEIRNMYENPFITQKNNAIIYQPNLKYLSITNNDVHIWGKCIKNEVYKNAINLLGFQRRNTYLCNAEDDVIVLMLFNSAKSFRFLPIYGIFHLISNKTATYYLPKNHIIFSKLFFLDLLFDFTGNNTLEKKYVFNNAVVINKYITLNNLTFNKENKKYLKSIMKKILNSPNISSENKTHLKHIFFN